MKEWDLEKLLEPVEFKTVETRGLLRAIVYPGEVWRGKPAEVFAWLGVPETRGERPVPGMICLHGGGGTAFAEWVERWVARGYAAIAMDFSGRGIDGKRLRKGGPEQDHDAKFAPDAPWEDMWTCQAIAAALRGHAILAALPEVDAGRIGATGISWGGYLTCILAGVDPQLGCAIPVYGCGHLQNNSAADWMQIFADMTPAQRKRWHNLCDPSSYLDRVRTPMLFVTGTNDFAYPLDSLQLSYRQPPGPVTLCIRPEMPHGHSEGWTPEEIGIFADAHLRGGDPLPAFTLTARRGLRALAEFRNTRPITDAWLLHTADEGPWQERKWRQTPAVFSKRVVSADIPEDATACYLAVEDERGAWVNTPHEDLAEQKEKP